MPFYSQSRNDRCLNAYLDDAGRPRVRLSIVGFIDILGFSQASLSCTTPEESQRILDNIFDAMCDSRAFVRKSFAENDVAAQKGWEIKFFSDNLALGCPIDDEGIDSTLIAWFIIRCAKSYQLGMAMNGYFVRGALTQGPICLTDEIIFGSALVESYQIESKASIVPRIVLTEPLQNLEMKSYGARPQGTGIDACPTICRDVDGWWFVNYLEAAHAAGGIQWDLIERHKKSILDSLSRTTRHEVLPKYGWACRYHNVFCHWHREDAGYSDKYRIDRVDEHSTIYRLGDD